MKGASGTIVMDCSSGIPFRDVTMRMLKTVMHLLS